MHPLLDEELLSEIHRGTYTGLGVRTEPFLILELGTRAQVKVAIRDSTGKRVGEMTNIFTLDGQEMQVRYQDEFDQIDPALVDIANPLPECLSRPPRVG